MIYFYAFLFSAAVCFLAQLLIEYTKLTPGHITSIFVVFGVILGICGLYPTFISIFGGGAVVPILNFGHLLTKGVIEGIKEQGFLGIFTGLLQYSSATLGSVVFLGVLFSFFFKAKA